MLFFGRKKLLEMDIKLDMMNALLNEERGIRQELSQRMMVIEETQRNIGDIILSTYTTGKNDHELFIDSKINTLVNTINQEIEQVKSDFTLLLNDNTDKVVTNTNLLSENLTTKMQALDVYLDNKFKDVQTEIIESVNSNTDRVIKNSNNLSETITKQVNLITNQLELIISRIIEQTELTHRDETEEIIEVLSEKLKQLQTMQKEQNQLLIETKEINVDNISQIIRDYAIITKTLRTLQNELTAKIEDSNNALQKDLDLVEESLKMLLLNSVMDLLPEGYDS